MRVMIVLATLAGLWSAPALAGDARVCRQWCGQDASRCRITCMQGPEFALKKGSSSACVAACNATQNRCAQRCNQSF